MSCLTVRDDETVTFYAFEDTRNGQNSVEYLKYGIIEQFTRYSIAVLQNNFLFFILWVLSFLSSDINKSLHKYL